MLIWRQNVTGSRDDSFSSIYRFFSHFLVFSAWLFYLALCSYGLILVIIHIASLSAAMTTLSAPALDDVIPPNLKSHIRELLSYQLEVPLLSDYNTISAVNGPLVTVSKVKFARQGEIVYVRTKDGRKRIGQVLEVQADKAIVQVI